MTKFDFLMRRHPDILTALTNTTRHQYFQTYGYILMYLATPTSILGAHRDWFVHCCHAVLSSNFISGEYLQNWMMD